MRNIRFPLMFGTCDQVNGVIQVKAPAWDGVIEVVPCAVLAAHLATHHVERVGTYLTVGSDPDDDGPFAYVGSGNLSTRLKSHLTDATKGEFDRAVLLYSPSNWLQNSRAAHIEGHLYRTMKALGQVRVLNLTSPVEPRLDGDADLAPTTFWREIAMVGLRHAGESILVKRLPETRAPRGPLCGCSREEVFRLHAPYPAFLVLRGSVLYIRAGSVGRLAEGERWAEEPGTGYRRRRGLLDEMTLRPLADGAHVVATADIAVSSPSQASCILTTQETAGPTAWRHVKIGLAFGEMFPRGAEERRVS